MKKLSIKKKEEISQEEIIQKNREKTAQQWIPISDIDRNIMYRKDNVLGGALRVQPKNLDLLSDNERKRIVDDLAEGYNGESEGFQIFCIGRPVDLNNYLESLQNNARAEDNFIKKTVLKGYIQEASIMASSGETIERRFYIILVKEISDKAEYELLSRLNEFKAKLFQAELDSEICNDDELLEVLSLFANPIEAALEKMEIMYDFPPLLVM